VTRRHLRFSRRFSLRELWSTPQLLLEEKSSPEKDDDREGGRRFPLEDPRVLTGRMVSWKPRRIRLLFRPAKTTKPKGPRGLTAI